MVPAPESGALNDVGDWSLSRRLEVSKKGRELHLLVQKRTKYTEDCCVNSIIFAFVFFVSLLNLGKPKKPVRAKKRGNKSTPLLSGTLMLVVFTSS